MLPTKKTAEFAIEVGKSLNKIWRLCDSDKASTDTLDEIKCIINGCLVNIAAINNVLQTEPTENDAKEILRSKGWIVDGSAMWCRDDVIHQADEDEEELTEDEIGEVMRRLKNVGADVGINWEVISTIIDIIVRERKEIFT